MTNEYLSFWFCYKNIFLA